MILQEKTYRYDMIDPDDDDDDDDGIDDGTWHLSITNQ
jgi:hypothetical protein